MLDGLDIYRIDCKDVSHKDAGFTLMEMLVAMLIFSILSVGTFTAFQSALTTKQRTDMAVADHEKLALMRASLSDDFSQIILRQNRDSFGTKDITLLRGGYDTLLEFTRIGRPNPGGVFMRSDIQRVTYLVEDGQFIRRSLRQENPAPNTIHYDRVLLDNIIEAEITFFRDGLSRNDFELFAKASNSENPSEDAANNPSNIIAASIDLDYITLRFEFDDGSYLTQAFELEVL